MAIFYDVQIKWLNRTETKGRGIGNNAAWVCLCGAVLLGPHEDMYPIPPCPDCGKKFKIKRGKAPQFVDSVEEKS